MDSEVSFNEIFCACLRAILSRQILRYVLMVLPLQQLINPPEPDNVKEQKRMIPLLVCTSFTCNF